MIGNMLTLPVAGVVSAFLLSNVAGQVIVLLLFLFSIAAWSLVVSKWRELKQVESRSQAFLAAYRRETHPMSLMTKHQRFEGTPLYGLYERVCAAFGSVLQAGGTDRSSDLFAGGMEATKMRITQIQFNAVRNAADKAVADSVWQLERWMGMIATTTTTAPLLGLLGTVWGAMDAFEKALGGGSVMLSAVAPGIAGALLTTVIGLLVAIPSGIGYNMLTEKIRRICLDMDNFSQDLMYNIERHYTE